MAMSAYSPIARPILLLAYACLVRCLLPGTAVDGGEVMLVSRPHDPYGWPRPGDRQDHVPLRTSFFFELGLDKGEPGDSVLGESITVDFNNKFIPVYSYLLWSGYFVMASIKKLFLP